MIVTLCHCVHTSLSKTYHDGKESQSLLECWFVSDFVSRIEKFMISLHKSIVTFADVNHMKLVLTGFVFFRVV